jgi:lipoprotein Spr
MKRTGKFLFLTFIFAAGFTAVVHAQEPVADAEQSRLQLCYNFSRLLGCEIDTLQNALLYQTVYEWLGTPYKYSGDCRDGVDCSGFVCMLYSKVFGIDLAHNSADIFKDVKPLKKNSLHEGDLVFFKIQKHKVSHVGIYLANNKFAHASVQNGVIISDLDEPYYKKYFFKGGKVRKTSK